MQKRTPYSRPKSSSSLHSARGGGELGAGRAEAEVAPTAGAEERGAEGAGGAADGIGVGCAAVVNLDHQRRHGQAERLELLDGCGQGSLDLFREDVTTRPGGQLDTIEA